MFWRVGHPELYRKRTPHIIGNSGDFRGKDIEVARRVVFQVRAHKARQPIGRYSVIEDLLLR
jgi:hypothetical protein